MVPFVIPDPSSNQLPSARTSVSAPCNLARRAHLGHVKATDSRANRHILTAARAIPLSPARYPPLLVPRRATLWRPIIRVMLEHFLKSSGLQLHPSYLVTLPSRNHALHAAFSGRVASKSSNLSATPNTRRISASIPPPRVVRGVKLRFQSPPLELVSSM